MAIRILVADDHYLIRKGLEHLIADNSNMEWLGTVSSPSELFDQLKKSRPDVVMIDYTSGNFNVATIEGIKKISAETEILAVSDDNKKHQIFEVLSTGVNSFVTKSCSEEEISKAIIASSRHEKFFCNKVLDILIHSNNNNEEDDDCAPTDLTSREIEIMKLVGKGFSTKMIADKLCLSQHTIYTHRKNIFRKLKVKSSAEMIISGIEIGVIQLDTMKY